VVDGQGAWLFPLNANLGGVQLDIDQAAVPPLAPGDGVDCVAVCRLPGEAGRFGLDGFVGDELVDVTSNGFALAVPKQALGRRVPGEDGAVPVDHHDGFRIG